VAMMDPLNIVLIDELRLISGYEIKAVQAEAERNRRSYSISMESCRGGQHDTHRAYL